MNLSAGDKDIIGKNYKGTMKLLTLILKGFWGGTKMAKEKLKVIRKHTHVQNELGLLLEVKQVPGC